MRVQNIKSDLIKLLILVIGIFCSLCVTFPVMAEEISGRKNQLDVMFVVDVSGSMRSNDPNGIALEMVKAFIDTVHKDDVRVGFVAYNDAIVTASDPVSIAEQSERNGIKELINATKYTGNTDIGLGLSHAYGLMPESGERERIIVLISDGVSDLTGSVTGRTLEQSNQELEQTVTACQNEGLPVYTIAFGTYSGSKEVLQGISDHTNANSYDAKSPEMLIEVLYGIFENNLAYKIQQFSAGRYADGKQDINCTLTESYLSEIDVLLISPDKIGKTNVFYGGTEVSAVMVSYYAVAKISGEQLDSDIKMLTVSTETVNGQRVEVYVVGYRDLEPVLNIETAVSRNQEVPYQVYFKDKQGNAIQDAALYETFRCELKAETAESSNINYSQPEYKDGLLQGTISFTRPGEYTLYGEFSDSLGTYEFNTALLVSNTEPAGALPDTRCTVLSGAAVYDLGEWFHDQDGDALQYTLKIVEGNSADVVLEDGRLTINPQKSGSQSIILSVSDGVSQLDYPYEVRVIPLWQEYWWVIAAVIAVLGLVIYFKKRSKSQAEPVSVTDIKSNYRFNGRLDLYFTKLPEEAGEIPPLVFSMYKLRESRISLGSLLKEYPDEVNVLGLNQVYFIADEDRRMILFHVSEATVMNGNSIVCKQVRYNVRFGDVIYITSPDGSYELELHYIAMIQ